MNRLLLMIFLSLGNSAMAELLPQLETAANRHKELATTIYEERGKEVLKLQESYSKDLKAAELKSTGDGDVNVVKILRDEMQRLEKGPLPPNPPEALPGRLHNSRKSYLRNYERMDAAFDKRRNELDSAYLVQLGKLQKEHTGDETWTAQIASEKDRVLAGAWGPITDMRIGLPGTTWLNNNNGKETRSFGIDGKVDGRVKYETPDNATVIIHWGGDNHMPMHLQKDGKTMTDYNGSWTLLPKGGN